MSTYKGPLPSDRASDTPAASERTMAKSLHVVAATPAMSDQTISDAQRGLTRLAAVHGWTDEECRKVWAMLGVNRRVA